jgi:hypothetical protein
VSRHHAGTYVCAANNGFASEAREKIELTVEFEPEVSVEEMFIHSKSGETVTLVCVVHANPRAEVKWFKDGTDITTKADHADRHEHKFVLEDLSEEQMGNYTCVAENKWGSNTGVIEISGKFLCAFFFRPSRNNYSLIPGLGLTYV